MERGPFPRGVTHTLFNNISSAELSGRRMKAADHRTVSEREEGCYCVRGEVEVEGGWWRLRWR